MNTTKPVALITGGSRGIGLGCALALAREGYDLAIAGRRPESDCREALDSLRAAGAGVIYAVCNVADRAAREALMAAVRTHYGRLNVLVNNAGMAPRERRGHLEPTRKLRGTAAREPDGALSSRRPPRNG